MTNQQAEAITYSAQVHTHTHTSAKDTVVITQLYSPWAVSVWESVSNTPITRQKDPHHHTNHTICTHTHKHTSGRAVWCCILMIGVGNYCHCKP